MVVTFLMSQGIRSLRMFDKMKATEQQLPLGFFKIKTTE